MASTPLDSELTRDLFGTAEMRRVFSEDGQLQAMLDVEAALARVQAKLGIIPKAAATAITKAARVENLSATEIGISTTNVGYPVVALIKGLAKAAGPEAGGYVHWGATTQDILDSALVLQMAQGLDIVERDVKAIATALAEKARRHRGDVMAGRTHLQHALPITFGYKCAVWLSPLLDHLDRITEIKARVLRVQFGGAVGTLASLGAEKAHAVTAGLAKELGLRTPDAPWHVARETVVEAASFLGLLCGTLSKIAFDVILLMQSEVAEVFEPHQAGRGGSSTMPQKRNPIASEYVLATARGVHALIPLLYNAMAQDQERGTGPWQAEQIALPQIFVLTSGALAHGITLAEGMTVDTARMRKNLDLTGGLIMSEAVMMGLAPKLGRGAAHELVEHAVNHALKAKKPLGDILAKSAEVRKHLTEKEIAGLTEPESYIGEAREVVDRVLARAKRRLK